MKNLGKFKHIVVVGILIFLCLPAFAGRAPANYFPSDDFEVAPAQYKTKIEQIWIRFTQDDDEEGILELGKNEKNSPKIGDFEELKLPKKKNPNIWPNTILNILIEDSLKRRENPRRGLPLENWPRPRKR